MTDQCAHLPSNRLAGVATQVACVVAALSARIDELAEAVIGRGRRSGSTVVVPHDRRLRMHAVNDMRSILDVMAAAKQFDPAPATRPGRHWARRQIPVSALLNGYRIGFHRLWDTCADEAGRQRIDYEALRGLTDRVHAAEDLFMAALVAGYGTRCSAHVRRRFAPDLVCSMTRK
jgi:hypothetical protein